MSVHRVGTWCCTQPVSPETRGHVDGFWREVFGPEPSGGDERVVVAHGSLLKGYEGIYCTLRRHTAWISAPATLVNEVMDWAPSAETVMDARWWGEHLPGWTVLGPSVHSFADGTTLISRSVRSAALRPATQRDLAVLREQVTDEEWAESGFGGEDVVDAWILLDERGDACAASNLTVFQGSPVDVGILVAPSSRGRGLATMVATAAASHAVQRSGFSRWRALSTNTASQRVAEKLGFEVDCLQLALRPV
jgi:GNAT superfamily N-acetyltransferase